MSTDRNNRLALNPSPENTPGEDMSALRWSPSRGYHHDFGCIICNAMQQHLAEEETVNEVNAAAHQLDAHEESIRTAATHDLLYEVQGLLAEVRGLQQELADRVAADVVRNIHGTPGEGADM
jgi:hypothetical protein